MKTLIAVLIILFAFAASAETAQINALLTWQDNSSNEDGFKVLKGGVVIATVAPNTTTYTDTGIAPGATVCYSVVAFNSVGDAAASPQACATAPGLPLAAGSVAVVISVTP